MDKRKQNVVFILADDMGYGDFGLFGDGSSKTPNIDRLCQNGTAFAQYNTASPVCSPSRAAILTGRYPHRTGSIDTLEAYGLDRISLRETLISQRFKSAGYSTGLIGKWHGGAFHAKYNPLGRGFDEFFGFRGGWSDYFDYNLEDGGKEYECKGEYLTELFTKKAVDFIERHKTQPFFLMITYNAPHWPLQCPEKYVRQFKETGRFSDAVSTIYGMINCMDQGVGQILDALSAAGITEDTIVVFTSDNGPDLHGDWNRYNCGLRGEKCYSYEGGIKVPAIVNWPGRVPQNIITDAYMHGCDWFPTLLEACGIDAGAGLLIDGKSVLPSWLGKSQEYGKQRFWQWNRFTPVTKCNAAIKDGEWKLVWQANAEAFAMTQRDGELDSIMKKKETRLTEEEWYDDSWRTVPPPQKPELFRVSTDPLEECDLYDQQPEIREKLEKDYERLFDEAEAERRLILRYE